MLSRVRDAPPPEGREGATLAWREAVRRRNEPRGGVLAGRRETGRPIAERQSRGAAAHVSTCHGAPWEIKDGKLVLYLHSPGLRRDELDRALSGTLRALGEPVDVERRLGEEARRDWRVGVHAGGRRAAK
jgi:hypothetical protein